MKAAARPYIAEVLEKATLGGGDRPRVHQHPVILSTHIDASDLMTVAILTGCASATLGGAAGGSNAVDPHIPCSRRQWPPVTRLGALVRAADLFAATLYTSDAASDDRS